MRENLYFPVLRGLRGAAASISNPLHGADTRRRSMGGAKVVFVAVFWAVALASAAFSIHMVAENFFRVVYWDQWEMFMRLADGGYRWRHYLFLHNEHVML